jgi:hypothetical protein
MGSYPTQATPALAQLAQLGSLWSQRFLRSRQRLQALTFRKLLLCPAFALGAASPGLSEGLVWSSRGDVSSKEDCRCRLAGWRLGDGGPCEGIVVWVKIR